VQLRIATNRNTISTPGMTTSLSLLEGEVNAISTSLVQNMCRAALLLAHASPEGTAPRGAWSDAADGALLRRQTSHIRFPAIGMQEVPVPAIRATHGILGPANLLETH